MNIHHATYWISRLGLKPHPEGGNYKEVFRSKLEVSREYSNELKSSCTSIYYLLEGNDYSGFHRLASDEIWYFHKGEPLMIYVIDDHGKLNANELSDQESGSLSFAVKAGLWFASFVLSGTGFSLVSCAVAPGFEFSEFEMAKRDALVQLYPEHEVIIRKLIR